MKNISRLSFLTDAVFSKNSLVRGIFTLAVVAIIMFAPSILSLI